MAQKPEICGVSIHVCRIRVTRLGPLGNVLAVPDNTYVSDKPISVQLTPVVEQGADNTIVGGCDCIVASYRGKDKLKRFDFNIALAALEPAMLEMMLGATLIEDASDVPVPIGVWWPAQLSCDAEPAHVALEFWSDVWTDDAQNPDWPYIHHVYPSTYWQIAPQTYENQFAQPAVTGFSRVNASWGSGPHGDQGEAIPVDAPGGFFYTETVPPDADCGYQSVTT